MRCPYCNSERIELVSKWGGQIITSQVRCNACGTYFEAVREDFDARQRGPADGPRECTTS
jgi:uncharacterized Zn finger protein